jgi:hypothetical protein
MATYDELMTAIIKKQISIIGEKVALKMATEVIGIKVDNSGNVTGGNKAKLESLVDKYKEIAGGVAVLFAKKAIKPLLSGKEDLPNDLRG